VWAESEVVVAEEEKRSVGCGPDLDREEELEFRRQFLFRVETIGEVNTTNTTVGMHLHTESFYVVRTCTTKVHHAHGTQEIQSKTEQKRIQKRHIDHAHNHNEMYVSSGPHALLLF
jgi:hypothetical protein